MPNRKTHPNLRRHRRRSRRKRQRRSQRPTLRFNPTAWAKLLYLRDLGPTEVGGFAISDANDLLLVQDLVLVNQCCSEVTVAFEDEAVADFFDVQFDQGFRPEQFARIWVHTHPGDSADPSTVDVETFARVFGHCDWAVMFIVARGGETFAELHWRNGGPTHLRMNVDVDYSKTFNGTDHDAWKQEYEATVRREQFSNIECLDWFEEDEVFALTDFEQERGFDLEQPEFF